MDLKKNGTLLCKLRKAKGMTQKQVAQMLGVMPKTVSKWETGHGFVDVSNVSALAEVLGVSEKTILSGNLEVNREENGDMKQTKLYICSDCGGFLLGTGNAQPICCGKQLKAQKPILADEMHAISISEIEGDFYIEFGHEMTKEHYIDWVVYVRFDRVLALRLYPEQDAAARIPGMYGGKLYYHCNQHGLFEYQPKSRRKA